MAVRRGLSLRPSSSVTPAPDGRVLTVRVPCRTTPNRRVAPVQHDVQIHPDWSTQVPHDVPGERIAVAFGGHLSCVGLVDDVVPALRYWLAANLRACPPLFAHRAGRWTVADGASCCRDERYAGATGAAEHARSVLHAANRYGAEIDLLAVLAAAARGAHGDVFDLDVRGPAMWRATAACDRGFADVEYLYRCGLRPEAVVALHASAQVDHALPRSFYLAAAVGAVDPADGIGWSATPDGRGDGPAATDLVGYLRDRALTEGNP